MQREELLDILKTQREELLDILKTQRTEFKEDLENMRTEFKQDLENIRLSIKQDINVIDKRLTNIENDLSITKDNFNKYIKSDATGIEKELGETFQLHFKNILPNSLYKNLNSFKLYDCTGNLITELDVCSIIYLHNFDSLNKKNIDQIINFVIIEAKHKITKDKIVEKIFQVHKIINLIKKIPTIDRLKCHKNFRSMINQFNIQNKYPLENIPIDKILLYIGGPNWKDESAFNIIKQIQNSKDIHLLSLSRQLIQLYKFDATPEDFYETLKIMKNNIGIIKPSGNSYIINDILSIQNGGGKKIKYPMINKY